METENRFAVPVEALDATRVEPAELVQGQAEPRSPAASQWSSPLVHPFGDGATGAGAGDGD